MQQSTHSRDSVNHGNYQCPPYIQQRLNTLPPRGKGSGRHEDISWISGQLYAQEWSVESIFHLLRERYADQPDKTDKEIRNLIVGARKLGYKPAAGAKYEYTTDRPGSYFAKPNAKKPNVKRFKLDSGVVSEEIPTADLSMSEFLQLAFQPGETICITKTAELREGQYTIAAKGTFLTLEEWVQKLADRPKFFDGEPGAWIRVNPFQPRLYNGTDKDVAAFRHVLVEFDKREKADQWRIIKSCGLPIACVIDSGGKSLHAWIKLDAANEPEYKQRQELVYEYLGDVMDDVSNRNPSRWSRLPGAVRNGQEQKLVAIGLGAKSWEDRESGNMEDGLPEFSDLCEFLETPIEEPKHLLKGFLRVGQVAIISGAAKTNKSWTMMELALAVSQGGRFLAWEGHASKVAYIDTELEEFDFQKRMLMIARQIGVRVDPGEFSKSLLRGVRTTLDDLVPSLIRRLKGKGYELICLDAIYSVLGDREENANEDISQIGALLFELAKKTGAAVVFSHHFSKGKQDGKRGIEKASGAGAWGRFPEVSLSIDQHSQKDCYNFEPTYRSFAPQLPFVAERVNGTWVLQSDMKVEHKSNPSGQNRIAEIMDILVNECGGTTSPSDWFTRCEISLGIKRSAFDDRKDKAHKAKLIKQSGKTSKTVYRVAEGVEKDAETGFYGLPRPKIDESEAECES